MGLMDKILTEPAWLVAWVMTMMVLNTAAVFFLSRTEARWILAAWVGNLIFMSTLFEFFGYVRLLGLSHVIFWTPLLVYLFARRNSWDLSSLSGKYIALLFAVNATSLVIDYIDVGRWLAGARAPLG